MGKYKLLEVKEKFYRELYPDSIANPNRCGYADLAGTYALLFLYELNDRQKEQHVLGILEFLKKKSALFDCAKREVQERYSLSPDTRRRYKKWLEEGRVDVGISRKTIRRLVECCLRVRGFKEMFWYEFLRTLFPKLFLCLETQEEPSKSDPQAFLIKEYEGGRAIPFIRVSRARYYHLLKEVLESREVPLGTKDYPGYSAAEIVAGLYNYVEATQADRAGDAFRKGKAFFKIA